MRPLLDRRSLLGAFVGAGAALLGVWLAGSQPEHLPYTVLLVIAIAIVGFAVGYLAAAWAYGVGLLIILMAVAGEEVWTVADTVRFIAFLFGSPVIVYLARRAEDHRAIAARALATSHDARRQADEERERLERASRELDTALGAAERERATAGGGGRGDPGAAHRVRRPAARDVREPGRPSTLRQELRRTTAGRVGSHDRAA